MIKDFIINMAKYIRKRAVVEAHKTDHETYIHTCGIVIYAAPGDYIVTNQNGVKYVCKPKVFEQNYEEIDKASEMSSAATAEDGS